MAENGNYYDEHFDDRRISRSGSRSGRVSPSHSAHASLYRTSILKISADKKAKKVRFYRNGDRFFKGMIYAVSPERFRTFESLLAELTHSPLCDNVVLPNGVRHVFTLDGGRKVTSLDQLEDGESYVCATTNAFSRMDYQRTTGSPNWNVNVRAQDGRDSASSMAMMEDSVKEYIKPKLVTIIRNGTKPRKAVRVLLNKKTAHSFDQVLTDITEAIKLDSGAVRKLFTLDGRHVTVLADFFKEDSVFIAYGPEKYSMDDFDLDNDEMKMVSPYRSGNSKPKERVTMKSPKSPRRISSSSRSINEGLYRNGNGTAGLDGPARPTSLGSPKLGRRSPGSPRKTPTRSKSLSNGHTNGNHLEGPPALCDKYAIGKLIGEGNFAVVKSCSSKRKKKEYALKIIDKTKTKGKEKMIENEVSILRRVKHPNIILLIEEFDTPSELYLVMELVKGGDLFDAIATATKYTERDASGMLYNLMSAVKYLHSLKIVHRDIKPENLLVCEHEDGTKSLKLGDFGLATEVKEPLMTVCGTPTYVAPEILSEAGYGVKVDIWAAGVITYILLCGFPPFVSTENNQEELFDQILSGKFEFTSPFWDESSDSARELISSMLQVNPEERLSAADVLEHPWVCDDTARDDDMHEYVTKELSTYFVRRPRDHSRSAGIALIANTALDKGSRFFQAPKGAQLQPVQNHDGGYQDEVF